MTPDERFWTKVGIGGEDECWPWLAATRRGYGRFGNIMAHRVAYLLAVGPIPDGLQLDHLCHDASTCRGGQQCPHRRCVNPKHLEPVTLQENLRRSAVNGRAHQQTLREFCPQGHPYKGKNLIVRRGHRFCRECDLALKKRTYSPDKARLRRLRLYAMTAAGHPAVPHGTATGYSNWGCRCEQCRHAAAEARRGERAEVGAGALP